MNTFDYSSLWKFISSIGLGLISASVAIPYFVFNSTQNLMFEKAKLAKLPAASQNIIAHRLKIIGDVERTVPYISAGLFIVGFVIILYGIIKWKKSQAVEDESKDLDLEAKKKALRPSTSEEIEQKNIQETKEAGIPEQDLPVGAADSGAIKERVKAITEKKIEVMYKYLGYFDKLEKMLKSIVPRGYRLQRNMSIDEQTSVDFVLAPGKLAERPEYILEFKYASIMPRLANIYKVVDKLKKMDRRILSLSSGIVYVLIYVVADNAKQEYVDIFNKYKLKFRDRTGLDIRFMIFAEDEFAQLSNEDFKESWKNHVA